MGKKIALFADNAKIHRADIVQQYASTPEIDIKFVWSIPYRPDLMGVELVWREAKRMFKN